MSDQFKACLTNSRQLDSREQVVAGAATSRSKPSGRTNDPDGIKRNIIEVATTEFANRGLSGARIDEIAAKTDCSKRMIYYYFDSKEGLYLRVLENAYRKVRVFESGLELENLAPCEALERLVGFTFDHHNSNEEFIRLVMIENIHHAKYLSQSSIIQKLNSAAIDAITKLLERGEKQGVFRPHIDPIDLHWKISALCFFNVSNRATFSRIFQRDLSSSASLAALRESIIEMIGKYVHAR